MLICKPRLAHRHPRQTLPYNPVCIHRGHVRWVHERIKFHQLITDNIALCTQPSHQRKRLSRCQSAGIRGAGARYKRRVKHIDIEGDERVWSVARSFSHADRGNEAAARSLFPEVVNKDWDISTEAQAESITRDTLNRLKDIREQYNVPRVCS